MRNKFFAKLDSANEVLIKLKENDPGNIYYLKYGKIKRYNFNGCFEHKNIEHLNYYWNERDVIDVELVIKKEGIFHFNKDGSRGWTIYRDEIRKLPK